MDFEASDRLEWLLRHRHSARQPFDPDQKVREDELVRIIEAARWAPTAHNMQNYQLIVVDDPGVLAELARIRAPITPTFITENYQQLVWSPEELVHKKTGILGTTFPREWWTGDPDDAPQDVYRSLGETIAGAPMVILVLFDPTKRAPASKGDVLGMISLGCVLENMWLAAQAAHLDAQVAAAFADGAAAEVKRVLGIPPPWRIAFGLRLGHAIAQEPKAPQPRVRRDRALFLHRNRFT